MNGFAGLVFLLAVIAVVIVGFVGADLMRDMSENRVEERRIERQMELDKMEHERQMYMLHSATVQGTVQTLSIIFAMLCATFVFVAFLAVREGGLKLPVIQRQRVRVTMTPEQYRKWEAFLHETGETLPF